MQHSLHFEAVITLTGKCPHLYNTHELTWPILMSYIFFFLSPFCLSSWAIPFFIFDNKILTCNIELRFYFGCIRTGHTSVCVRLFCCVGTNKWIMNKTSSETSLLRNDLPVSITRVAHLHFCAIHCVLRERTMLIKTSFAVTDGRNY